MLRYASKRVVLAILVALAVSFAAFLLLSVATDPASAIAGEGAEPEVIEHIREQLGLNRPLLVQYGSWLLHVFHGDFGTSYYWHQPVGTLILHHLPVTLTLALSAIFVTLIVAIPLGTIANDPDNPMAVVERAFQFIPFTPPFNMSGQPAINIPVEWTDAGLPVGVQLVAGYGREDVLLQVASQLEANEAEMKASQ